LKVMDSIVTSAERVGDVAAEVLKVAVSPGLTGAMLGDQLVPEFQLAEIGTLSQLASMASAEVGPAVNNSETNNAPMKVNRANAVKNSPREVTRQRRNLPVGRVVIFLPIMVIAVSDV
jgi:hypothetical protein